MYIDLSQYDNIQLKIGLELARALEGDGQYEAYLVGGCVRDLVRHQFNQTDDANIHDIDIATSMPMDVMKEKFRTASNNGEKHGTVLVFWKDIPFEVTHFRTDGEYTDGRHPDSIQLTDSFKEDTARRDFTINSLGLKWNGDVIDYHGGVTDIKNKIIRTVGDPNDRFQEDALRMIRGIRFAINFNYIICQSTAYAMSKNSRRIANVSNERIRSEFLKLKDYDDVSDFISYLRWNGLLDKIEGFRDMDTYVIQAQLSACRNLLTAETLFPALCYTAKDESNLDAFVPTREERKTWNWLRSYKHFYAWYPEKGRRWTSLVELVSGPYELLLALNHSDEYDHSWLIDLPAAKYVSLNMPPMKPISNAVAAMGIPQGKEFGEKVKELLEIEYKQIAEKFPKETVIRFGNCKLTYQIKTVEAFNVD